MGKRIRIFMSGDYEFLSRMYGISGAQGTCINMHVHTLYMYMIYVHIMILRTTSLFMVHNHLRFTESAKGTKSNVHTTHF